MPSKNPRTKGETSVVVGISVIVGIGAIFGLAWLVGYSFKEPWW